MLAKGQTFIVDIIGDFNRLENPCLEANGTDGRGSTESAVTKDAKVLETAASRVIVPYFDNPLTENESECPM